jgi:hypothetical protein
MSARGGQGERPEMSKRACSTAPKGPDPDLAAVQDRLKDVKNKILVLSGKGGP